ncbi:MAG: hypothetical protein F4059_00640 [Gemmatimonadetes bacterium]|nr:hypothetical protein [Gemmatimonadota bacterium]
MTGGIVAATAHPLHDAAPEPRALARWPWIDFDGPAGADAANRRSLAAILDELRGLTGQPVRAVLRAGSAGLTLLADGPWLAWLPLDLLDRLPGAPLRALPPDFGRRRYRTGFVARRSAEVTEPFRMLEQAVREAAPGRSDGTTG